MGKYSNVNVNYLLNETTKAINELSQYKFNTVKQDLNNKNVLSCAANQVLITAINQVIASSTINGSISNLNKKLINLKSALNYITKYQQIEKEISSLQRSLMTSKEPAASVIRRNITLKQNSLKSYEQTIDRYLMN